MISNREYDLADIDVNEGGIFTSCKRHDRCFTTGDSRVTFSNIFRDLY